MDTINAFHTAPIGYARAYVTMEAHVCKRHADYRIGCHECGYSPIAHTVAMVDDVIALILDRDDGSVVEWVTDDGYGPDMAHLSHDGTVLNREEAAETRIARALIPASELVADCFRLELSELYPAILPIPALFEVEHHGC